MTLRSTGRVLTIRAIMTGRRVISGGKNKKIGRQHAGESVEHALSRAENPVGVSISMSFLVSRTVPQSPFVRRKPPMVELQQILRIF